MASTTDFQALRAVFQTTKASPQSKPWEVPDPKPSSQPSPAAVATGGTAQPQAAGLKGNPAFAIFQNPGIKLPPTKRGWGKPPTAPKPLFTAAAQPQSGEGAEKSCPAQVGGEQDGGERECDALPGDGGDGGTFREKLNVWEKNTQNLKVVKGPSGKPKGYGPRAPRPGSDCSPLSSHNDRGWGLPETPSPRPWGDRVWPPQRDLPPITSLGPPPTKLARPHTVDLSRFEKSRGNSPQAEREPSTGARSSAPLGNSMILANRETRRQVGTKFQGQNLVIGESQQDQSSGQKEKREKELRRFNLTGSEIPVLRARVQGNQHGGKTQLTAKHGEVVDIIRMVSCPTAQWLARSQDGNYGYIQTEAVKVDTSEIREVGEQLSRQSLSSEEIYDDVAAPETSSDDTYSTSPFLYDESDELYEMVDHEAKVERTGSDKRKSQKKVETEGFTLSDLKGPAELCGDILGNVIADVAFSSFAPEEGEEGECPIADVLGGVDVETAFKGVKVFAKLFKKGRKVAKMKKAKSQSDLSCDQPSPTSPESGELYEAVDSQTELEKSGPNKKNSQENKVKKKNKGFSVSHLERSANVAGKAMGGFIHSQSTFPSEQGGAEEGEEEAEEAEEEEDEEEEEVEEGEEGEEGAFPIGDDLGGVDAETVFKGAKVFAKIFKKGRKIAQTKKAKSQPDVSREESTEADNCNADNRSENSNSERTKGKGKKEKESKEERKKAVIEEKFRKRFNYTKPIFVENTAEVLYDVTHKKGSDYLCVKAGDKLDVIDVDGDYGDIICRDTGGKYGYVKIHDLQFSKMN